MALIMTGSPAVETGAEQSLPDVFNLPRVPPQQIICHIFDCAADGASLPFDNWLAPAYETIIGGDLQEEPARRNGK